MKGHGLDPSEMILELTETEAILNIAAAHQLGLKTVAEGVETRTERDLLAGLGCDRIQGYLIGKPVEGSGFLRWMLDRRANLGPELTRRQPDLKLTGT